MFHYDLRGLFLTDHFHHAGLYDTEEQGLVLRAGGIEPTRKCPGPSYRIMITYDIRDESEVQEGLAKLLVRAAGKPTTHRLGLIGRKLKSSVAVVLNPLLLEAVQDAVEHHFMAKCWAYTLPSNLRYWAKFIDRPVYLSRYVPFDQVIGVFDDHHSLLISTPGGLSPYPMGAAVRGNNTAVAYRIAGAEELLPERSA